MLKGLREIDGGMKVQKKILGWIFWVSVLAFVLVGCGEASSRITDGIEANTKRED